jgi:hypothetical protein
LVELADLTRATGLLHPIIHLGFGIEFNQPAIVAQGLAEAACHELWIEAFLLGAEKAAGGIGSSAGKPLAQLIDEARQDKTLAESARWSDANKIKDGTFIRAFKEMCNHASQYTVSADHLEEQVAEMINANGNLICSLIQNWHSHKLLYSIFYRGIPAPSESHQIRFLSRPLLQLFNLLLLLPLPSVDQLSCQGPPSRMERAH